MEFVSALTLVLGSIGKAIAIETLAGGVTGNRTDALVMALWKRLRQDRSPLTQQVNVAVWLAYKQALVAIAKDCQIQLIGPMPQFYRGQPRYPTATQEDIRWYNEHLKELQAEIKAIKQNKAPLAILNLSDIDELVASVKAGSTGLLTEATTQLSTFVAQEAPNCYRPAIETRLTKEVYAYFAQQASEHQALWMFVQMSILNGLERSSEDILNVTMGTAQTVEEIKALLLLQSGPVIPTQPLTLVTIGSQPNPFMHRAGQIEDPDLFWGRARELNEVFSTLNSGMSVALIGEREIGKSSLLRAIERNTPEKLNANRKPLYVSLHDVFDEDDFYYALCHSIGIETCKGFKFRQALQSQRILLLLDEIEKMTWDGFTNQVRSQLRGLAEGSNAPFKLVVTASQSLDRLFPDSGDGKMVSPLAGICLETVVKAWSNLELSAFIQDRLESTGIVFTSVDVEKIIRKSQGNPKKVVGECYVLYAKYQDTIVV